MSTTARYTRRHRIATGGMGEVWLAHDEVLDRDVAVKYLKSEYADDEGFRTRFLQEARSAAPLHHPGIATVFDFGDSGGPPFLVMEYVDGRPLSELLAEGPLDPEQAREIVHQAALALAEAHAAGLVHRDVKPGNVLVTTEGAVKITDFGIARAADGMALTETGQVLGTPSYLSPEQAEGQSATAASDVYALGVVLFECLTGRRPYDADSPVAIALAHVREPVPELPPDVPRDLAAVTRRALAKHPDERYPDAGAFAEALRAAAPEPTMLLSAPVAPAPAGAPVRERLGAWLLFAREHLLWVAVGLLALVIVVALLVSALTGATTDKPSRGSSPSVSKSAVPRVSVDPSKYVGKQATQVRAALTALGLSSRVVDVDNPDRKPTGTVKALSPVGSVRATATITLYVWKAPPPTGGDHGDHSGPGKGKGKKGKH